MPTNTPNVSLAKPLVNEKYDVDILNENFDKLDLAMAGSIEFPVVTAGAVTVTPTGNLSSTNVQTALVELDSEKASKLFATNLVTNGDFSNGTTGWSSNSSTNSVSNNTLSNIANGTMAEGQAVQQFSPSLITTNNKYCKMEARVTNANCTSIIFRLGGSGSIMTINNPIQNQWYMFSGNFINESIATGSFLRIYHTYVDASIANGKVMEVQYVSTIDLTAIFGAGNEPTKEQMDRLLSIYPNRWFNGTSEIGSIGALIRATLGVQVVTPTLLNSRTGTAQYVVSKDGLVVFRGTANGGSLNTSIFVLPENIRPIATRTFPISANNAFGVVTVASNGGVRQTVGALTSVSLDGIVFKVGM